VTYDGNGNTGGIPPRDDAEYYIDDPVKVMGRNNLTKTGARFIGWHTDPNGLVGTAYQPDATFNITGIPSATVRETFTNRIKRSV
jgi:hypothetical protein